MIAVDKQKDDDTHPFAETFPRWPNDILLRKHGFKIYSRPKWGGAYWIRGGVIVSVEVAIDIASRSESEKERGKVTISAP